MKAIINTPTPNLETSIHFYKTLKYQYINDGDHHYVLDDKLIIRINPDRYSRPGIIFYKDQWEQSLNSLKNITQIINKEGVNYLSDPNGVIVECCSFQSYPDLPVVEFTEAIPGKFVGISIEAFNFKKTIDFWSSFGYNISNGDPEGGWATMENESSLSISLMKFHMCPHLFFNPSFTYFNGNKNIDVIARVRELKIPITEEITIFNKEGKVDNIIIRDPGGFGFFIFND